MHTAELVDMLAFMLEMWKMSYPLRKSNCAMYRIWQTNGMLLMNQGDLHEKVDYHCSFLSPVLASRHTHS